MVNKKNNIEISGFDISLINDLIEEISMGPFGSDIKVDCFVEDGVPLLNGSNLNGFKLTEESFRYVTPQKAKSLKKAIASKGDIVITHRGTLGQIVYIPNNAKFDKYVISQSQFRVRCNKEKVLPEYLVYYFHTPLGQYQLLANKSQVGVPALARASTTFRNIEICIPPLPEQRAIADTLSCLDDMIELNNRTNKVLEEMAQAIFKRWFIDFEFPDENGNPYKSSGGEMEESELGEIPVGWRVGTLEEISEDIICGKTPLTNNKENFGNNIPFITIPDMHNKIYITKTERYLSVLGANSQKNKNLPQNSICVSCIATAGLVALTSKNSQTNQQINSIVCKDKISCYYVFLYMKLLSEHIKMLGSSGSATNNLNKTQFSKIKILITEDIIMRLFHKSLQSVFDMIKSNQEHSQILSDIRDSLLPKLMSGEIRVPVEEG